MRMLTPVKTTWSIHEGQNQHWERWGITRELRAATSTHLIFVNCFHLLIALVEKEAIISKLNRNAYTNLNCPWFFLPSVDGERNKLGVVLHQILNSGGIREFILVIWLQENNILDHIWYLEELYIWRTRKLRQF